MNKSQSPEALLHSLLLDGNGGASELSWDDVNSWTPEKGCLWLHFDLNLAGVEEWLRDCSTLDELAVEALLSKDR